MSSNIRSSLLWQFDVAWKLASYHLTGLTTDECLWRPAGVGLHVTQDSTGAWRADWPEHEGYEIGPPSIAWVTWHIGFWWSMVLDHGFGNGTLSREQIVWPGSAGAVNAQIHGLCDQWLAILQSPQIDFASTKHTKWPFESRPLSDLVAWANIELVKNAAELGYGRFLYATRS